MAAWSRCAGRGQGSLGPLAWVLLVASHPHCFPPALHRPAGASGRAALGPAEALPLGRRVPIWAALGCSGPPVPASRESSAALWALAAAAAPARPRVITIIVLAVGCDWGWCKAGGR